MIPIYDLDNAFNNPTAITVPHSRFPYTTVVPDYRAINTQVNRR